MTTLKHARNFSDTEKKISVKKLSVEHTLYVQPEGYQEAHNEGPKAHPGPLHQRDLT